MGRRKTAAAVLALVFSLFSLTAVYGAEQKMEAPLRYTTYEKIPENAEALEGEYIPILMYHHFADRDMGVGDGMVTSVEELEDHIKYFKSQGYKIISLEKLDTILKSVEHDHRLKGMGLGLEEKYLCITMDDGYFSNYKLAYPIFKKYQAPASVFAITDFITEQYGLQKFTWKQAQEMDKTGWLKVYSHTADHLPVEEGMEEIFLSSMQKSQETIAENLQGKRVKAMAYPNGIYTEISQKLLSEDGYVLQFTIEKGVLTRETKRTAIPRITVESGMTGEDVVREIELAAEKAFAAEREGKET